jgi:molybdopterin-guanine dinucleotide biosynthesis protein A
MSGLLGAVLAGGRSTRFGSDKALAMLDGVTLLDRALDALAPYCAALVVVGRDTARVATVRDRPAAGLGPLGGLAGALAQAAALGLDGVLTTACDTPLLPPALVAALLARDAAFAAEAPTVGHWPVRLALPLLTHLANGGDRSIRRWAAAAGVVAVCPEVVLANVNTAADLARLGAGGGDAS